MSDTIQLTEEQAQAIDSIQAWLDNKHKSEFRLGGYAGTGKTTLIKFLQSELKGLKVSHDLVAFTGKACNVLQKKGLSAQTIHSLIYNVIPLDKGLVTFTLKDSLEDKPRLIIIDEASMISRELYDDLRSFDTKLLFVGDPGQLEPIGDNPNLMAQPDFTLQTIHRQAAKSPIISLANNIRHGKGFTYQDGEELTVRKKAGFRIPDAAQADQVLCARNKTRLEINIKFRQFLNRPVSSIQPDDKIIVLRNNRAFGVFNGMILFIQSVTKEAKDYWLANAKDETGKEFSHLPIWKEPFGKEMPKEFQIPKYYDGKEKTAPQLVYADWGYCITCHKAQGSEWDHVLVWDEWMHPNVWDMKRWRYTAITRAAKKLTYCL